MKAPYWSKLPIAGYPCPPRDREKSRSPVLLIETDKFADAHARYFLKDAVIIFFIGKSHPGGTSFLGTPPFLYRDLAISIR